MQLPDAPGRHVRSYSWRCAAKPPARRGSADATALVVGLASASSGQVSGKHSSSGHFRHDPLVEEFGVVSIAELVDYPDKAPASVGAIVTNLRLRTTKKGEKMAWLTLADGTGAIECAVFPNAYERLAETSQAQSSLRERAFLVARGRVAQQEATRSKLFIDEVQILGGTATQLSALAVAIAEQPPDEWSALGDEPGRPRRSLGDRR